MTIADEKPRPKYVSPSQIMAYRWCPRNYYHEYIERSKKKPSLALISGNVVHQGISDFLKNPYAVDSSLESDHYEALKDSLVMYFQKRWTLAGFQFDRIDDSPADIRRMYFECRQMIRNWFELFYVEVMAEYEKCGDWNMAVARAKPKSEVTIHDDVNMLCVRIDLIDDRDRVVITDLKTGRCRMTDDLRVQLELCALAYHSKHGKMPHIVQDHFLASDEGPQSIPVTDDMLDNAKAVLRVHNILTASTDIKDYPCTCGKCEYEFEDGNERD